MKWDDFEKDLEVLLNRHSVDNECNTPDFLLAEKITADLKTQASLITRRENWHGRGPDAHETKIGNS